MSERPMFREGAALVVGGSGGVGQAICAGLARAGTDVALTYRARAAAALEVIDAVEALGRRAEAYPLDLADEEQLDAVVKTAAADFGRLHTVVFCAGARPEQLHLSRTSSAALETAIEIETRGFFRVVQSTLPRLRDWGGGAYVHLGSAGEIAWAAKDGLSIVPKAANAALVRGIAREEGRFGVRANSVLVGVIEAGMFLEFSRDGVFDRAWIDETLKRLALKRLGRPEEVADAVVFLASERAAYVTGQQLAVAGGYGV